MIWLDLFVGFLKVGMFSFGGAYGAIPLIRDVVLSYGWMTDDMITYMVAVSESTPGPIMVNMATYVGSTQGGLLGALLATLAVILPSFAVILLIMIALEKAMKNKYVQALLRGLKPCVIGIVLATGAHLMLKNVLPAQQDGGLCWQSIVLAVALSGIMFVIRPRMKKKISPIGLIVLSAALGAVLYALP